MAADLNAYLNEQFDILCLYGEEIIKSIMSEPDPSLIDIYFKFSYFLDIFLHCKIAI